MSERENSSPVETGEVQTLTVDVPLESDCVCNEVITMKPEDILSTLNGHMLQQANAFNSELNLAFRRQGDGAAFDMRLLNGALTNACITADDPMTVAGLNTAVRTPTTIDHPSAIVGK